ncbi:MAG TPA: T9SS type A sorting domain-containing protein [Sphingobacteriaceae bacterium]
MKKIYCFSRFCIAILLLYSLSAFVADLLITNHSFESGLTGWTQMYPTTAGNGSITVVTEQADDGTKSLKVVDNDATKNFGMESTKIACSPGGLYAAYARVRLVSGTADLYLRFWNGTTLLSGPSVSTVSGPFNQWQNIAASGTAPSNATHMSVMVYSNVSNIGTAYWDKMLISREFTNLGVQVYDASPNGTTFGIGANAHKAYCVVVGANNTPPKMVVIDTNTETVLQTISFPSGPTGGWGATTSTTGDIYFGMYSNGTLYRHVPGSSTLTVAGSANDDQIFDLAAGTGGRIYGGTYKDALFFSYTPATPNVLTQISTRPFLAGHEYVRTLAHDAVNGVSYLSAGVEGGTSGTGIYRYHHGLGEKVQILPTTGLAGIMTYTGGRVFAGVGATYVLNVVANANGSHQSTTVVDTINPRGRISPALNGKVYYFLSNGLFKEYDIATKTEIGVGGGIGYNTTCTRLAWLNNKLVGIVAKNNSTYVIKYDPAIPGSLTVNPVNGIMNAGAINEVQGGPDGKIYTSAYLTGGLGVYDPIRGDGNDAAVENMYTPINQIDRMVAHDSLLYIGSYPGANLYQYNPAQPWVPGTNPKFLMGGGAAPYYQDRPKAIVGANTPNGNFLFAGAAAQTGKFNGGVLWYNLATQVGGVLTITNQSAISMAVYGTQLYVGTSIRRGYATTPNTTSSKVVVYNITSGGLVYAQTLTLPVANLESITKMLVVGTKIWGFADGYIFVLNPTTKAFEACELKFPAIDYGGNGTYRDADMFMVPKDPSNVYGTIGAIGPTGYLVKIPIATRTPQTIITGADKAAYDSFGTIYYHARGDNTKLYRYALTVTSGAKTSAISSNEPTITSFSGCSNTGINLAGTNFSETSAVTFGGAPAGSFTVNSPTSITAIPNGGASGEIAVTTPNGTARITGFKFVPIPQIEGSNTLFQGGKVLLTAASGLGYRYKWSKNGLEINGESAATYSATTSGAYTVGIVSDSCIVSSKPFIVESLSGLPMDNKTAEEHDINSRKSLAYPNPFEDLVTLNLGKRENTIVVIRSVYGKIVFSKTYSNVDEKVSINLAHLDKGMYLVKVSSNSFETVYKIYKK